MEIEELLNKVGKIKEAEKIDLSSKEDLAIGVMNLISIEEHLYFTYKKTNAENLLNLLNEVREMRKNLLLQIVKNPKGEIWCISKHLLAAAMRLIEVGTKKLNENKVEEAKELFDKAYQLWNIFWGLNLNLIDVKDVDNSEMANTDMISITEVLAEVEKKESSSTTEALAEVEKKESSSTTEALVEVEKKESSSTTEALVEVEKKESSSTQKDEKSKTENVSIGAKLGSVLQKILDCCRE
ncbi:MAG: hypothetical protein Q7S82_00345 [bacterium]|nr:hypothetical protein [bacterium]